jgi:hypothetical protein
MPLTNLAILTAVFIAIAVFYYFRGGIIGAVRRFDERNRTRRAEEIQARFDCYAHYRQTLALAEEQIEEVMKIRAKDERTGQPVERFLFHGETFATLKEAEEARYAAVVETARDFYKDLDRTFLTRWRRREAMRRASDDDYRS